MLDDDTLPGRRGSLKVDDEGCASQRNVLIEHGILKGFIQDEMNAGLMGAKPTFNGRRESYAHTPMPRVTNMLAGDKIREGQSMSARIGAELGPCLAQSPSRSSRPKIHAQVADLDEDQRTCRAGERRVPAPARAAQPCARLIVATLVAEDAIQDQNLFATRM